MKQNLKLQTQQASDSHKSKSDGCISTPLGISSYVKAPDNDITESVNDNLDNNTIMLNKSSKASQIVKSYIT